MGGGEGEKKRKWEQEEESEGQRKGGIPSHIHNNFLPIVKVGMLTIMFFHVLHTRTARELGRCRCLNIQLTMQDVRTDIPQHTV